VKTKLPQSEKKGHFNYDFLAVLWFNWFPLVDIRKIA